MVTLNLGIQVIEENLNMSFEIILLLLVVIGAIIFFSKGLQFGSIFLFISTGLTFMLTYALELNYSYSLVVFMCSLVLMALSLYLSIGNNNGGIV